jgi:hypothetical protein
MSEEKLVLRIDLKGDSLRKFKLLSMKIHGVPGLQLLLDAPELRQGLVFMVPLQYPDRVIQTLPRTESIIVHNFHRS